jgi:tRNA dimethylallyltransferase
MPAKTVIVITGPTGSGKTALAIEIAQHFHTSIMSADSRQCFRELNIGVAKPTATQLALVKHEFISSHSIQDPVNAALFESLAIHWCEEIFSIRDVVVMAGGTGLYIKAFRDGLDEIPAVDESIRRDIQQRYQAEGLDWLKEAIRLSDPLFYATGEISNPQRMMRALEVIKSTGRSILAFRNQQKKKNPFRILEFGIRQPRKELYHRIDHRVDQMMDTGLLEEVKSLIPYQHLNALQTVGYKELFDHLNGKMNLNDSISLIKQNTRRYAKRQLTWCNSQEDLIWLEENFFDRILEEYTSRNRDPV